MKFKLTASGAFYDGESAKKLTALGFPLKPNESGPLAKRFKFYLQEHDGVTIEIETLDALMEFVHEWGQIVLSDDTIEIYNDYRE
jgi:hypothetical protein